MSYRLLAERALADIAPKFAWPGGYPIVAFMEDGEIMCPECCAKNRDAILEAERRDSWRIAGADIFWEGPPVNCCNCNREIESAYGDPEAE
jgi:hypothetical protein